MTARINESKPLTKLMSCKRKCKYDSRKYNLDQKYILLGQ